MKKLLVVMTGIFALAFVGCGETLPTGTAVTVVDNTGEVNIDLYFPEVDGEQNDQNNEQPFPPLAPEEKCYSDEGNTEVPCE